MDVGVKIPVPLLARGSKFFELTDIAPTLMRHALLDFPVNYF